MGTVCRGKRDSECDLEEYCSGDSPQCPADSHVHDGIKCAGDNVSVVHTTRSTDDFTGLLLLGLLRQSHGTMPKAVGRNGHKIAGYMLQL